MPLCGLAASGQQNKGDSSFIVAFLDEVHMKYETVLSFQMKVQYYLCYQTSYDKVWYKHE